jgi:MSHA biogenesis protein MshJ
MNKQWQEYCEKYLTITPREQYMVLFAGLAAIIFIIHSFFIDDNAIKITKLEQGIAKVTASNRSAKNSITLLQEGLSKDPNAVFNKQITQYKKKLKEVDEGLLKLTSDLIDPIQMRYALLQLLKTQKGVSLQSFQVIAAQPITMAPSKDATKNKTSNALNKAANDSSTESVPEELVLYRHAIKIKLSGSYFQLRDYLQQLEALSWKFFWQEFNYQLKEYPVSELEIEMYSLSTKREFIGV